MEAQVQAAFPHEPAQTAISESAAAQTKEADTSRLSEDTESSDDDEEPQVTNPSADIRVSSISPDTTQSRKKRVLLPLIPLIAARLKSRPPQSQSIPHLDKLSQFVVGSTVRAWSVCAPTRDEIACIVQACILGGDVGLFIKTVWSALKTATNSHTSIVDFIRELQMCRAEMCRAEISAGSSDDSFSSLIREALTFAIQKASFTAYTPQPAYPYYGLGNRASGIGFSASGVTYCELVLKRLLESAYLTPAYIENVLAPFLPELRQWVTKHQIQLDSKPFSDTFKMIAYLWVTKVLGPKPSEATQHVARMRSHDCTCAPCTEIFRFLTTSPERSHRLECIGAPKRRHVEQQLLTYAGSCAQWSTITTSPQGLSVMKTDLIYQPIKWKATLAQSPSILKSISDKPEVLRSVFGADYQSMADLFYGRKSISNMISNSLRSAPGAGLPSVSFSDPAGRGASNSSATATQLPTTLPSVATQPSRKRKATYNVDDVIDLT
ncbi:hypothetical protein PUNSTDRAFT_130187 [Punctularia strigosozonata HHB-11173 SS5]|uniref:uncharacterized protein n=1 Tax=Punctularia strigosozonata (strain HHB-11173) TaxID=741275 RepID=UPI0004417B7F|nr:uncharacterized protein PUNSTDRAFT_130187 [Punctularia strigosozonata HHB-11173 SS5]EIN14556.1 hypothetical protein PUNSTDRAFT_130187 [Punctularia strigosozonata HHB-11173 SS5]